LNSEQEEKMDERIENITTDLLQVAQDATEHFGSLPTKQLNWKPDEKSWSIAQCFDHVIKTHSLYFPLFERLANGGVRHSFWENYSPLSGFFGRFLIKSLDPKNEKKMKTTAKAQPSASEIDAGIIDRFAEHQNQIIEHLQSLPADIEPTKTIITSPLLGFVTYSLDDCYTILVVHAQRHFGQAKRVTEKAGLLPSQRASSGHGKSSGKLALAKKMEPKMENSVSSVTTELHDINCDVQQAFGSMSAEHLNWKPGAESWSIAQCLDHLIKTNEFFYPDYDRIASGTRKNSLWENWSPLTGIGGRFLIRTIKNDEKKIKAPSKDIVPPTTMGPDIVDRFIEHTKTEIEKINGTESVDWTKTVLTSPFIRVMTYTLDDYYSILVEHNKRHIRQAKRVAETDGFPN
jgi:uncharacterized damage-inducible protein DinB